MENKSVFTPEEFIRIANNFYNASGLVSDINRISVDSGLLNYFSDHASDIKNKYKIAFVWICLNPPYWEFAKPMIEGAKKFFLPGHDVDYFLWSDMPKKKEEATNQILSYLKKSGVASVISKETEGEILNIETGTLESIKRIAEDIENLQQMERVKVLPMESIEWPMPTLLRYHTFLQQEELLKTYDYIFYCDVDMAFVNIVGDEILGEGLTTTMNPMYALASSFYPPYEPNPSSTAYIKRPGQLIKEVNSQSEVKARFMPQYYAGGFQGGKADKFIEAMKVMKKNIDEDLSKLNYVAIWNDESHWNKYLSENSENLKVLSQSYLYPDSLIEEYYKPRWGRDYQPKLITLTKKFSTRPLSFQEIEQLNTLKPK